MKPHPLTMMAWTLALSLPLYVWGIYNPIHGLPFGLPGTAVMIVVPAIVASALTYLASGRGAVPMLWRLFDVERIKSPSWLALAALTMPAASVAAFWSMRALALPLPGEPVVDITAALIALLLYFAGAALEEVGWTGYCTEPMQQGFGVPVAGVVIGAVWAAWHLVPWTIIQGHPPYWVIGQTALTILMRVVMGYIYARGGRSLFLATLFHATINTSYSAFPNGGSHYDPVMLCAVLAIAMLVWALARYRWHAAQ